LFQKIHNGFYSFYKTSSSWHMGLRMVFAMNL